MSEWSVGYDALSGETRYVHVPAKDRDEAEKITRIIYDDVDKVFFACEEPVTQKENTCGNCGTPMIDAIVSVIQGKAACCPECTTLTTDERNIIRMAMKASK